MNEISNNNDAEQILTNSDLSKAQSFLLEGQKGIGKREIAINFACKVLQNQSRVRENSHPDFLLIQRRFDEKTHKQKPEINAEDARKLSEFLNLTPAEGNNRICIIDSADKLNINAANSILKTLEEPSKRSIIILLSHGGHVLPTIRSRCVSIKFSPINADEFANIIKQDHPELSDEDFALLSIISDNSPGIAKNIIEQDGLNVSRETLRFFENFPNIDQPKILKFAKESAQTPEKFAIFNISLKAEILNIAKKFAKNELFHVKQFNFDQFLNAEKQYNEDIKNAEIYNLDKKQVIIDILNRFSACYA